ALGAGDEPARARDEPHELVLTGIGLGELHVATSRGDEADGARVAALLAGDDAAATGVGLPIFGDRGLPDGESEFLRVVSQTGVDVEARHRTGRGTARVERTLACDRSDDEAGQNEGNERP